MWDLKVEKKLKVIFMILLSLVCSYLGHIFTLERGLCIDRQSRPCCMFLQKSRMNEPNTDGAFHIFTVPTVEEGGMRGSAKFSSLGPKSAPVCHMSSVVWHQVFSALIMLTENEKDMKAAL